jgi:hypothetical protein
MRILLALASTAALLAACGPSSPPEKAAASPDAAAPTAPETPAPTEAASSPDTAPPAGEQGGTGDWRQVALAADADNLNRMDQAWRQARDEAEDAGFADELKALGPLVEPGAAQTGRLHPAPGAYRCRTIKIGARNKGGLAFVDYPFFRCTVELTPGGDLILTKTTGSQRTRGLLYPDTDNRLVFIGAQAWGDDETRFPAYGEQPVRNQVGSLERIGSARWRLVIPWPALESKLEILELIPA